LSSNGGTRSVVHWSHSSSTESRLCLELVCCYCRPSSRPLVLDISLAVPCDLPPTPSASRSRRNLAVSRIFPDVRPRAVCMMNRLASCESWTTWNINRKPQI
jgi:hypothetical protein